MRYRSIRRLVGTGIVVGGLAMGVLAGTVSSGAVTHPRADTTLYVAEPPNTEPLSVFAYYTGATCFEENITYWNLMYRPAFWFGLGNNVTFQPGLSSEAESTPHVVGGNTVVTISEKPNFKWAESNGGPTEANDNATVEFWLNMDKAESSVAHGSESTDSCGYSPNIGFPDQVKSVVENGGGTGTSITITFNGTLSDNFLLYNQLSQIQPMPVAWDITAPGGAPGSGGCSSESFASVTNDGSDACSAVFGYLSGLPGNNSIWNWADGPYRQSAFGYTGGSPNGIDTQIANTDFSVAGDDVHAAKTIHYVPETSEPGEQGQLQNSHGDIDFGYLDPDQVSKSPGPGKAGHITIPNMTRYEAVGSVDFGVFYWNVNFGTTYSTDPKSKSNAWVDLVNQEYFRGALQEAINQAGIISHVDNGYATPSYSAIPKYPTNPFAAGVTNPYPFSASKARKLLTEHGFKSTGYPAVCEKTGAAGCGTVAYPVPKGTKAVVTLLSPTGDPTVTKTVAQEVAMEKAAGIDLVNLTNTQDNVGSICYGGTATWQLCNYGGWLFDPDFYPSGEVLFLPGAGSNDGGYNSSTMNCLIHDTDFGNAKLNQVDPACTPKTSYAQWSAQDVPFIWQPTPAGFGIQIRTLKGEQPPNPFGDFNPEFITTI